jgi:hypothetical protein
MESALISSKRESRSVERNFDFPTAVGPNRTTTGRMLSGVRVAIPDLLGENLFQRSGDDLAPVGLELVVSREIDLDAALHCRARHFIYISLEAFQEIKRYHHGL